MAYDINAALEKLEQNLKNLESARSQVESTVKSSAELQKVVGDYVTSVKTLCLGLQSWEADLRARGTSLSTEFESAISHLSSTCTEIINTLNTNVGKTTNDFKTKTDGSITKFVEQNKKLSEKVLELNTLREEIKKAIDEIKPIKESLTQLSKDLKDSQKEQDIVLDDIKQKVTDIPVTIKGYTDAITEKLETINQGLKTILDGTNTKIDLLNEKADNLKNATAQLQSIIQSSSESVTNAISSSKEETAKAININRWIIIIGIIILAALQFIIK